MTLRCLIVDDEPIARNIIKTHANKINALEVIGECSSAVEANNFLIENEIDLLFLDIQMPTLNGIEFLQQRKFNFDIILTTAYSEYALESYKFSVTDYLLKPISFSRFNESIQKVFEDKENKVKRNKRKPVIYLKVNKKIFRQDPADILFIQGYGNYLKIFLKNGDTLVVLEKIHTILQKLSGFNFIRIHKSYIINLDLFHSIEGNMMHIEDHSVPISKSYKEDLLKRLQ